MRRTRLTGRLTSAELEARLTAQELAEVRDGKVIPTPKVVALVDSLRVERRSEGVQRATKLG